MNYKSIKHSFLIILIATTIVGCAGNSVQPPANSVQPPASQYQTSNSTLNGELIESRDDTSSIDVEDVDKEAITNQESENPPANLGKKVGDIIITTAVVTVAVAAVVTVAVAAPEVAILMIFALLTGGR